MPSPFDDVLDLFKRRDGSWRADPMLLWGEFRFRLALALERSLVRGRHYYVTSGTRFFEEQERLYQAFKAGGPRAAPAGLSAHQYGLAVDLAPDADTERPGLQGPDYSRAAYAVLLEEVERVGLASGASFGDLPHVGMPGYVRSSALRPLRAVYLAATGDRMAKLTAVWTHLGAAGSPE